MYPATIIRRTLGVSSGIYLEKIADVIRKLYLLLSDNWFSITEKCLVHPIDWALARVDRDFKTLA